MVISVTPPSGSARAAAVGGGWPRDEEQPMDQPGRPGAARAVLGRRSVLGAMVGAAALAATAACDTDEAHLSALPTVSPGPTAPAELTYTLGENEVISPGSLVAVTISHGQLDTVTLVDGAGNAV